MLIRLSFVSAANYSTMSLCSLMFSFDSHVKSQTSGCNKQYIKDNSGFPRGFAFQKERVEQHRPELLWAGRGDKSEAARGGATHAERRTRSIYKPVRLWWETLHQSTMGFATALDLFLVSSLLATIITANRILSATRDLQSPGTGKHTLHTQVEFRKVGACLTNLN